MNAVEDLDDIQKFVGVIKGRIEAELLNLKGFSDGAIKESRAEALYNFLREDTPDIVVETGVCNGLSTAVILKALYDNGRGQLYSIDLPKYSNEYNIEEKQQADDSIPDIEQISVVPEGKDPGWVIPEDLRSRWELIIGDSMEELPALLSELDSHDIFFTRL